MKLIAILIAKCASFILTKIQRGGSFPGQLALRICPDLLNKLTIPCDIIVVSGTNGKTSTSNMIADLFQFHQQRVISNRKGDNLKEGIATTLLNACSITGRFRGDIVVLEVDELNVPYIIKHLPVTYVVITNFFRDQLDRSQEMEQLIRKIENALVSFQGVLLLNGDDPNVVRIADQTPQAKVVYFRAERCSTASEHSEEASEGKFCPRCDAPLVYQYYQYSHIGSFHCCKCHFQSPKSAYCASDIVVDQGRFQVLSQQYQAPVPSLYSIYNCMAVIALCDLFHLPATLPQTVFAQTKQPAGRNETFHWQNQCYTLNLVKNPTGANEVLKTIELDPSPKALMIVLNDHAQDGTDVSWIYDAQFERVLALSTQFIVCSGRRAYDMALRIKYAGYQGELLVQESIQAALDTLYARPMRSYLIATYTALAPLRNAMRKEER